MHMVGYTWYSLILPLLWSGSWPFAPHFSESMDRVVLKHFMGFILYVLLNCIFPCRCGYIYMCVCVYIYIATCIYIYVYKTRIPSNLLFTRSSQDMTSHLQPYITFCFAKRFQSVSWLSIRTFFFIRNRGETLVVAYNNLPTVHKYIFKAASAGLAAQDGAIGPTVIQQH